MNEYSFEAEVQKVFLTEAQEMLDDTETTFMELESNPDDVTRIDKIFRLVHTIKGSAHVAGFAQFGHFAHAFETLLGAIRDKKFAVDANMVDLLLAGNDTLKRFVSELNSDPTIILDVNDVLNRIHEFIPHRPQTAQPKNPNTAAPVSDEKPTNVNLRTQPTILVVDDEQDILHIVHDILKDAGYNVITSDSSKEALGIFSSENVDAIFSDLMMPEMNGIEFVQELRKANEFIPVVFISGHATRDHFKDFLDLDIVHFVDKPFDAPDILAAAVRAMRESHLKSAVIELSRLSFKAFVSTEKILATIQLNEQALVEKSQLDKCMDQMRAATVKMLEAKRALRS